VILADLDQELAARITDLVADGTLPPRAIRIAPGRTWRPAPHGDPAGFATSAPFELAALAGRRQPAEIAARLAAPLSQLPWVAAAEPTGGGYLTITVTPLALTRAAIRLAAAGPHAGHSAILAGTTADVPPWPDLWAAVDWQRAWQDHVDAMTGRLAACAGAAPTVLRKGERRAPWAGAVDVQQPTVAAAVAWYGVSVVRYGLARTAPGHVAQLSRSLRPGTSATDPLYPILHAYASATSVRRWADELGLASTDPADQAGDLLTSVAERRLLGLLPWLPVRVAAAASRHRPDELPGYLEAVAAAWLEVRLVAPALPFGGRAAATDSTTRGARLVLAGAVAAVLASGLAMTGASLCSRDD
jgi:arginyl-tRNA synthetase